MSDLDVNKDYKPITLAPFGPIGIISHTSNKDFVKRVSDDLSSRRKRRSLRPDNVFANTPGYYRENYVFDSELIRSRPAKVSSPLERAPEDMTSLL